MCLATPVKLVQIIDNHGFVEHEGKEYKVELLLIENPKIGDWLLTHGEMAISRLPEDEALKIIELVKKAETR